MLRRFYELALILCIIQAIDAFNTRPSTNNALNGKLSDIFEEMWNTGKNSFEMNNKYIVDIQSATDGRSNGIQKDQAPNALFAEVQLNALRKLPTINTFIRLLDNYKATVGVPEVVSQAEMQENENFLTAFIESAIGKLAHKFASENNLISGNENNFKSQMNDIWFTLYKRWSPRDSSAFEHIFVGENRGGTVMGLHSWLQYVRLEAMNLANYKGYFHMSRQCRGKSPLVTIAFAVGSAEKPKGSFIIGSLPEFDVAICTLAYLARAERVHFRLDGCPVQLIVHRMPRGDQLASCYVT